jgi:hypothetical protein
MGVGVADAHAENAVLLDHDHDFIMRRDDSLALVRQKSQYLCSTCQAAERLFA